jgi:hypothetical protein
MVIHLHGDRSVFLVPWLDAPERIDAIRASAKRLEPERLLRPLGWRLWATVVRSLGSSSHAAALPR